MIPATSTKYNKFYCCYNQVLHRLHFTSRRENEDDIHSQSVIWGKRMRCESWDLLWQYWWLLIWIKVWAEISKSITNLQDVFIQYWKINAKYWYVSQDETYLPWLAVQMLVQRREFVLELSLLVYLCRDDWELVDIHTSTCLSSLVSGPNAVPKHKIIEFKQATWNKQASYTVSCATQK